MGLGASMRPPEFTGGNVKVNGPIKGKPQRFNEAAGIHRRKHDLVYWVCRARAMLQ